MTSTQVLVHYGIPGMKWGRRKGKTNTAGRTKRVSKSLDDKLTDRQRKNKADKKSAARKATAANAMVIAVLAGPAVINVAARGTFAVAKAVTSPTARSAASTVVNTTTKVGMHAASKWSAGRVVTNLSKATVSNMPSANSAANAAAMRGVALVLRNV